VFARTARISTVLLSRFVYDVPGWPILEQRYPCDCRRDIHGNMRSGASKVSSRATHLSLSVGARPEHRALE
jgi:hypothetical protein